MRKFLLTAILIFSLIGAQEKKGGIEPCLMSCLLGPRIGLEMNEGKPIETIDIIRFVGNQVCFLASVYAAYETGYKNAGMGGCMASCCFGNRVGSQLRQRRIRTKEFLLVVPFVNIVSVCLIAKEAYDGKTMTQIEAEENLRRNP